MADNFNTEMAQLHKECFEKRKFITRTIQGLPHPRGIDAVAEITYATQVAYDLTYDEAHVQGPPDFTGTRPVCILSWSFEDESLCRGLSDHTNHSAGSQHGHHWLLPRQANQLPYI